MLIGLKSSYLSRKGMISAQPVLQLLGFLLVMLLLAPVPQAFAQPGLQTPQAGRNFLIYQKAKQAFAMGDYQLAIQLGKMVLGTPDPGGGGQDAASLIALSYAEQGDVYNANNFFQQALSMNYNNIKVRNNYGVFMIKSRHYDGAAQEFQKCIRIDPHYPDAHYHLGECLQNRGDLDKAIDEYETAVHLKPDYFEAIRDLGLAMYERISSKGVGEISESLEKLKLAAQLSPDNPMIHYHLGRIYCADGKLDDAEAAFREALAVDPQLAVAHFELGRLRYYRGDLDRCVLELKVAAGIPLPYAESKKYPKVDMMQLRELMGKAQAFKGQYPQAIEAYQEVASMKKNNQETFKEIKELEHLARSNVHKHGKETYSPEQLQALIDRAIAQTEDGHLDQANSTFQQGLAMDPVSFQCIQNIGLLKEASGDLQGAMTEYKKAAEIMPKYEGVYYNMAYLLEKLGLPADAGMMYQRFHEVAGMYPYDPKHIVAMQQEDARQRARAEQIRKRGY
jgi:tetratricopeptide (TPR) repeat protein